MKTKTYLNFKVLSFNIKIPLPVHKNIRWESRRDKIAQILNEHSPLLLGLQEANTEQIGFLQSKLSGYNWVGQSREGFSSEGEHCPIFYFEEAFELLEHDTFWLSPAPEIPGSRFWHNALPRIVTWANFRHRESGKILYHFNTHFDHISILSRRHSAKLLIERLKVIAGDYPVIVTGDLNSKEKSKTYQIMSSHLLDTRKCCLSEPKGPKGTFLPFKINSRPWARIDYIFVDRNITVHNYIVLDGAYYSGSRPSDHMPVLADIALSI